jgi:hypothetical protein
MESKPCTLLQSQDMMSGERIRVDFAGPTVPRLNYQGKSRCLRARIRVLMVAGRFAVV